MDYSKISVITPSFNQGNFLEETILSVIKQNYPNLEYIIIDGGSTDGSIEIIKKYEKHLAYWVSEADKGQTHAINKGLNKATGDIITYLNSDDLHQTYTLSVVNQFFNNHSNIDIVYGDVEIIEQHSVSQGIRKEIKFDRLMGLLIGFGIIIPQPSTFWRRKVTEKIGLFNEENNFTMDQDYWFRASRYFRFKHISVPLAKFRIHQNSKTYNNLNTLNSKYYAQHLKDLERFYNELYISKFINYKYSFLVRVPYRLKRILTKLLLGKYF